MQREDSQIVSQEGAGEVSWDVMQQEGQQVQQAILSLLLCTPTVQPFKIIDDGSAKASSHSQQISNFGLLHWQSASEGEGRGGEGRGGEGSQTRV